MPLNSITPHQLTQYVNFNYIKENWYYSSDDHNCMEKLQAEGAAKAWNVLLKHDIALLADEVGTGKTIQALAIMMTLWRQKPDARILLYAPNANVAKKWVKEYGNFIRAHYRVVDDNIKSSIIGEPLRSSHYCDNHADLVNSASSQWPSFYVCKISSLSNFVSPKLSQEFFDSNAFQLTVPDAQRLNDDQVRSEWMKKVGLKSNEHFYNLFSSDGEPPVDLLIIDEAHYLRRTDGQTNRALAANAFFQHHDPNDPPAATQRFPLAKKTLLLTATPNHTASQDINNIVSLFKPAYRRKPPEEILNEICIRRFRRLQSKTKHQYREEIPVPVSLDAFAEKLFFAAYQKNLVLHQSRKIQTDKKTNPYRVLFGYLEGLEFMPGKNQQEKRKKGEDESNEKGVDFHQSEDSEALKELVRKYRSVYHHVPKHPKYDRLINDLSPEVRNICYDKEKSVVFVRRIPSVYEISRRLLEVYGEWFMNVLAEFLPKNEKKRKKLNLRKHFAPIHLEAAEDDNIDVNMDAEQDENIPSSKILDLFTKKKIGKYKSTDCSNFRLRFTVNTQVFSLFFQPALNYRAAGYHLTDIVNNGTKPLYKDSFILKRIETLNDEAAASRLKSEYFSNAEPMTQPSKLSGSLDTLLGLWWKSTYSPGLSNKIDRARQEYHSWETFEKEGFSAFLEKGILLSSPYVVHFYSYYRKIIRGQRKQGEELYEDFCREVATHLEHCGLADLIAEAILSFKFFYQKEYGIKTQTLIKEKWSFFNFTIPIYPYCGNTQRESILRAFNTPFFPNVLVATSVLQEGVDLHLHCSKLIHYGIAWTQGDNEQRVGRVDRMFGKLDKKLLENSSATLPIQYPYLAKTLDQDQLSRFIIRKHRAESLIDRLKIVDLDKEMNLLERTGDEWQNLFGKPIQDLLISEPFGVLPTDFASISSDLITAVTVPEKIIARILNSLERSFGEELVILTDSNTYAASPAIAAIKHIRGNERHQPVIVELQYFERGRIHAGKPVYCLQLKSPLSNSERYFADLRHYGALRDVYRDKPYLKICFDDKLRKSAFRMYLRCDIPLIIGSKDESVNLSDQEIEFFVRELISFADDLEHKLLDRDIKNSEVISTDMQHRQMGNLLPADNFQIKRKSWKEMDGGLIMCKENPDKEYQELFDTYKHNHHDVFSRSLYETAGSLKQVCLYKKHVLDSEFDLMEGILMQSK